MTWPGRRIPLIVAAAFVCVVAHASVVAHAQEPPATRVIIAPEESGLRFAPDQAPLARREASGPGPSAPGASVATEFPPQAKERFETIVTPDNIDFVTRTYVVRQTNAADLFQIIANAVALEGGTVERIAPDVEFVYGPEGEVEEVVNPGDSWLVVTAPEWMFPGLDQTIAMLDRPGVAAAADGTGSLYVSMRNRRPSEVAALLADTTASGSGLLIPDDANNLLYIEDAPADFADLLAALPIYDIPQPMARFDVEIVELENSADRNLGVYWDAWKEALPEEIEANLFFSRIRFDDGDTERLRDINVLLNGISPQAAASFLNYLIRRGAARVESRPSITVVQGEVGRIDALTRYPYRALARDEEGVRTFVDAEAAEGVTVRILPFIGTETMTLEVEAEVTSLVGFSADRIPILSASSIQSRAVLRDGETLILGGLKRIYQVESTDEIPLLGSIPLLGYLFKRESTVRRETEILIRLTPAVPRVGPRPEVSAAAEESRGDILR